MTEQTPAADVETQPAAQPAPAPKPEFATMAGRSKIVPLKYPIRYDGQIYSEIPIRRVTGAELSGFVDAVSAGEKVAYPGVGVPLEVYEALDADDTATFNRELNDFLPQGFGEAAPAQ
ncbi:MAG: phage tail assembly protein [Devosia sp.]